MEKQVSPHFEDFLFDWSTKFQFLVGGYGSGKSYHVALKIILKLLAEKRTALVVREVYDTHRDSTFSLLSEIIHDLELENRIKIVGSPMQIRFPNGSKIIFKGMDKPAKLKSINNISLVWLEECSEIKYDGFKELTGRLRHPTIKLHMILSTNPVSKSNWSYMYFFNNPLTGFHVLDDETLYKEKTIVVKENDCYYHHSTADDNMFLGQDYIDQLEELKIHDPDLYRIARKGQFGVNGTLVLPQFEKAPHNDVMQAINEIDKPLFKNGMDFGFVESYNALIKMAVDKKNQILYIYWEYYKNNMTDDVTVKELADQKKILIKADSAEPKTIEFFRRSGFRMMPTRKFAGSRIQYTKKVKRFKKIICSDACPNTIRELHDLTFKTDKTTGEIIEDEFNIDPHTFSAIWYGLDDYEVTELKGNSVRR